MKLNPFILLGHWSYSVKYCALLRGWAARFEVWLRFWACIIVQPFQCLAEFGGSDYHFVQPCPNPDAVATVAFRGAFEGCTQTCIAPTPIYVSCPLWPQMPYRLFHVVNAIKAGSPLRKYASNFAVTGPAVGLLMHYKKGRRGQPVWTVCLLSRKNLLYLIIKPKLYWLLPLIQRDFSAHLQENHQLQWHANKCDGLNLGINDTFTMKLLGFCIQSTIYETLNPKIAVIGICICPGMTEFRLSIAYGTNPINLESPLIANTRVR